MYIIYTLYVITNLIIEYLYNEYEHNDNDNRNTTIHLCFQCNNLR